MTVGASVGAPFGLKTEYEPGWVGRYRALTSDVKTGRPDPVGRVQGHRRRVVGAA
jgi:long-chain fatty acid transport protein